MNVAAKALTTIGIGFLAMAVYDYHIATYANQDSRLFGFILWKFQMFFAPKGSSFGLAGAGISFLAFAAIEILRRK